MGRHATCFRVNHSTRQHSTRQHSTRQHSTRQHSTRQHSTRQHSTRQHSTRQSTALVNTALANTSTRQYSTCQLSTRQHQHSPTPALVNTALANTALANSAFANTSTRQHQHSPTPALANTALANSALANTALAPTPALAFLVWVTKGYQTARTAPSVKPRGVYLQKEKQWKMKQGVPYSFVLNILVALHMASAVPVIKCPSMCQCTSEYYVYCQSSDIGDDQLASVVSGVSPSAVLLDLSSNRLTRIERETFRSLTKLEYLNLASNRITDISDGAFVGLSELEELNLRGNNMRTLGNASFQGLASLKDLHLGGNVITSLPTGVFLSLSTLEKLHLQRNVISDLLPRTFLGLERLQRLNLSQNLLKTISGHTFSGLASLKRLSLTDNLITDFSVDAFKGLVSLEELLLQDNEISSLIFMFGNDFSFSLSAVSLSGNSIASVPSHVFPNNVYLKRIDLSLNSIRHIGGQSFINLYLEALYLHGNNLTEVSREMLDGAKRISELNLSRNRIADVSTGAFDSFRETLLNLDLHSNQLTSVHQGMFRGMRRLRVFSLAANAISEVESGSFQDMEKLEEFNLSGNKFSSLSADSISGPTGLRKLLLVCNPMRKLTGFVFDDVADKIYIETNSTMLQSTPSTALVTWPYTEGSQLYWTLSVTCITSSTSCWVPAYDPTLRPYVTQVTLSDLAPGAEYYVCVSPVFLSTDVNVSQCVHIRTQEPAPSSLQETTPTQENVRNSAQTVVASIFHTVFTLLLICSLFGYSRSPRSCH
ncbi:hypothetical protein Btru_021378 [Bulinus truncatus]|nr:hypothetical protein Btru_021378 [Bulinus truncatus]